MFGNLRCLASESRFGFPLEVFDPLFVRLNWRVHVVVRKVKQERLIFFSRVQKRDRFFGQPLRQVFAFLVIGQLGILERSIVTARRRASIDAADVEIESLIGRKMSITPKVPLAGEESLVAVLLERFCDRNFLQIQIVTIIDMCKLWIVRIFYSHSRNPIGDVDTHRMSSRQNAGSSRRTNGAGSVSVGELHA